MRRCDGMRQNTDSFDLMGSRLFLRGRVTVEVEGLNQARLINTLRDRGVRVVGVKRIGARCLRLIIYKSDIGKTFAILDELCYTYREVSRGGVFAFCKNNLTRVGAIIGVIAVITVFGFLRGDILKIELTGLESIAQTDLHTLLSENGIKTGIRVNKLDRDAVRRIVSAHQGIADCSVEIRGSTFKITVIERTATELPPEKGRNIVAKYDADVTRIIASSGTVKVAVGDYVKKDTLLIEGALYDTNGELMHETPASGIVYGKIVKTVSRVFSTERAEQKRTGRKKTQTVLRLFGGRIGRIKAPYASYDVVEETGGFDAFFKLNFTRVTHYETETVVTQTPIETLVESFKAETAADFFENARGLDVTTDCREVGENLYEVFVYVRGETAVGGMR